MMSEPGYSDHTEHLRDELTRVAELLHAHVADELGEPAPDHRAVAHDRAVRIAERVARSAVPLRLPVLARRFGLTGPEVDALLLCLLWELSPDRDGWATLTGSHERRPTVDLVTRLVAVGPSGFTETAALFLPRRALVGKGLLRTATQGEVWIDERIARHLGGDDGLPDELEDVVTVAQPTTRPEGLVLALDTRATLNRLAPWLADHARGVTLLLHGDEGSGRRATAAALCGAGRHPLLVVDAPAALRRDWPEVVRLCYREALLHEAAVCWAGVDQLSEPEAVEQWSAVARGAAGHFGTTFLTATRAWEPSGLPAGSFLRLAVPRPSFPERLELWRTMLPPPSGFHGGEPTRMRTIEHLANMFRLTPGQIRDAIGTALGVARLRDPVTPLLTPADLTEGCRRQAGRVLVGLARRVSPRPHLTMDDLVLPNCSRRQLDELHDRIATHGRIVGELGFGRRLALGRGVVAMFTGGPGTGKTMAAGLLAQRHGLDLYKVDIAAVASRWVGETEKHLDRIFDDAASSNAVLFFDEADALFAKRGVVTEARDRWANVEMSFLLQRIEEHEGVVVLATNLPTNIDAAFFRRVHVLVDFPAPDAAQRLRIWQGLIPAELTYPPSTDLVGLAERFPLSGGGIANVVVDAAFRAVAADPATTTVTLRDVVVSVGREYQKTGLPITPAQFGPTYFGWVHDHLFRDSTEG